MQGSVSTAQIEEYTYFYAGGAYVKDLDADRTGKVSGVLPYTCTGEELIPDFDYSIGGNRIGVKTLGINKPFTLIATQLTRVMQ